MIISKEDDLFLVKVFKEYLPENFDIFDKESITEVFKEVLIKLKKKYQLSGLFDVEVYVNPEYGFIMEVENIFESDCCEEMDVNIHIHLDSIFMNEIDVEDISKEQEVYYWNGKFYGMYHELRDSGVLYKNCLELMEKGIRIC